MAMSLARAYQLLAFRLKLAEERDAAFHATFTKLMGFRFKDEFVQVIPWGKQGDEKCDGWLPKRRKLFQVYAPTKGKQLKTVSKIKTDFRGACEKWDGQFDTWVFVQETDGLPPDVARTLEEIKAPWTTTGPPPRTYQKGIDRWGPVMLHSLATELEDGDLTLLVGPAPTFDDVDAVGISELLPILERLADAPRIAEGDVRDVPVEKLDANQLSEDTRTLIRIGMTKADLLTHFFRRNSDPEVGARVATSLRREYERLRDNGQAPDMIFGWLCRFVQGNRYRLQVPALAVVAHFFEACIIFEEPPRAPSN